MIKFLDFDGVIVDSIDECYMVSRDVYFGYSNFLYDEIEYKSLFYKYRGLVKPVYEYMVLHSSLEVFIKNKTLDFIEIFKKGLIKQNSRDRLYYEVEFFKKRSLYQDNDMKSWLSMNSLMPFGESLVGKNNNDIYIVTTKNKEATEILLKHYGIKVKKIYSNNDIKFYGSKGLLISHVLDKFKIKEALFLDDAIEHLETVNDPRVICLFADWGYGENSNFKICDWRKF